jgi:NAD(P)H dehydrogenase (quinone)
VLATGEGDGQIVDVVGGEALSYADVVHLVSTLSGRPVELVEVDDATYRDGLIRRGIGDGDADEYTSFGPAIRGGFARAESSAVETLTGRRPRGLREIFIEFGVGRAPDRAAASSGAQAR